ncbi:MAG: malonate transporter subunit MadM [Saprospiraceae bacterium]
MNASFLIIQKVIDKNGLVFSFLLVGIIIFLSFWVSEKILKKRVPGSAIAIIAGLVLAYIGGKISGGKNGIADIGLFSGFAIMGGAMFRDFTIVATAMGADFTIIKRTGLFGLLSLFIGILLAFFLGAAISFALGYRDPVSMATIGGGACTFIIGPVTGGALGASSEVISLSIAAGVIKSVLVTIATPIVAKKIGLNNPQSAMVYGGLIGTTSGVAAGLAATDVKLVPYGAITATFYTGLGCLLCPSILYLGVAE